ncbi:GNAT family N-acetyltransferase [Clostridium sp. 'deep sea']|uniref:GNAT family N-acetyltransferase n=1 Tax=Clostridium sp. 'deep sea' TaxID=2779445 RepID=UPI001A9B27C6|nr:GNAT family N-acetyltransferase [Clostridium sp. 'deep sea']
MVYILREHARHGLGKRMFKKIVKSLQEQGKDSIIIWMLKGNSAEYFYKKMSTVKVGEEVKIIGGKEYPIIAYGMKDTKKFLTAKLAMYIIHLMG